MWRFVILSFVIVPAQLTNRRAPKIHIGAMFDNIEPQYDVKEAYREILRQRNRDNALFTDDDSFIADGNIDDAYDVSSTMCRQMRRGVHALFGTLTKNTVDIVKAYTSELKVPYLSLSSPLTEKHEDSYVLHMMPDLTEPLLEVMLMYKWRTVYYIYNSREGLTRMQRLVTAVTIRRAHIRVALLRVDNGTHAYKQLQDFDSKDEQDKHVLLDLPEHDCKDLFLQESKITYTTQHHYLLANLGIEEIGEQNNDKETIKQLYGNGGINITGFTFTRHGSNAADNSTRHFYQFSSKYKTDLAADAIAVLNHTWHGQRDEHRAAEIDCYAQPAVPWNDGHEILERMRAKNFWGGTGRVAFNDDGLRENFELELLEITNRAGLAKIGSWSDGALTQKDREIIRQPQEPENTSKIHTVTSIFTPPFLMEKENNENAEGNDKYEGYAVDLIKAIAERMELQYQIVPVKDKAYGAPINGSWNGMVGELVRHTAPFLMKKEGDVHKGNDRYEGYCVDLLNKVLEHSGLQHLKFEIRPRDDVTYGQLQQNGSYDGVVGELMRKEADIAVAPLTITSEREKVIDFSKPFMTLGISIMVKKMSKEAPGVFSFMFPLSYEIWMCVIFAYIGVGVVLFLVSRFSPYEWHIEDNTDGPTVTNNFTIFNSLWFSLGAFMQQGCDIEPRSMSGRIVGAVWWFFTLIIISSYTANLAAFLTLDRMASPIESAEDLAKQTDIKYGTVKGGSTEGFFKSSTIEVYNKMWAFMSSDAKLFVKSNDDGVERVRKSNGKYAFLIESSSNEYFNQQVPCDTMKVGPNLDSKGYGVATPLGSPYRDRISLAVLELLELGELEKLEKKWWIDKGECKDDANHKTDLTSSLQLSNVAGIFYILVVGLVLSLAMALLEFLYKSRTEARRRKTSFSTAVKAKAKLSMTSKPSQETTSYTYAPAAQLISLDGYPETNTHTQV